MSILASVALLSGIGSLGAVALNRVAAKCHVHEDERISEIESALPGANCGGCGRKGCHDFAAACVKAGSLDGLYCPVAGPEGMKQVSEILGVSASAAKPKMAVVRCSGTSQTRQTLGVKYEGLRLCSIMNMTAGDYACTSSCLGCGDCVRACKFGAISIPPGSSLPVVDTAKCTGCAQCAIACPRQIIDVRATGPKGRMVWVSCSNCLKGVDARKQCTVACIACGLCVKACAFDAIEIDNNLAKVDSNKCKTCGKCVGVCPTGAMHCNFEIKAPKN